MGERIAPAEWDLWHGARPAPPCPTGVVADLVDPDRLALLHDLIALPPEKFAVLPRNRKAFAFVNATLLADLDYWGAGG